MKKIKNNANGILLCIFEIAVGILLLVDPIAFTTGIIATVGIVLLIIGLVSTIRYFRVEAAEAASGQYLAKGLAILLCGAFCLLKSRWFLATFPALTVLYGIIVLATGLGKIQLTCDLIRKKYKRWFLAAISAVLSVVCAAVILKNPFVSTTVLWMFMGISLIAQSVMDGITLIVSAGRKTEE